MTAIRPDISPYAPADLLELQDIRRRAFAPIFASFRALVGEAIAAQAFARADDEQAQHLDDLVRPDAAARVLVARLDGRIAGFAAYTLDTGAGIGEIGLNAVHPERAGRGIGTALYRHILASMKAQGMRVATVGTGGDPSHAAARRAYEKAGFGPGVPSVHLYKLL